MSLTEGHGGENTVGWKKYDGGGKFEKHWAAARRGIKKKNFVENLLQKGGGKWMAQKGERGKVTGDNFFNKERN